MRYLFLLLFLVSAQAWGSGACGGGGGAPTNSPTFTGQVTIGTGAVNAPSLQIETASEMGLYKVANGVMGFTASGSKGMQLAGNYLGLSVPTLYLNVDSTAAVDTSIVNNVNTGTLLLSSDSSGDTNHGGWVKMGGRSSSFGEIIELGAGAAIQQTVNSLGVSVTSIAVQTAASKPACDSTQRGRIWYTSGAAGVADIIQVCAKDAADAYAWKTFTLL